MSHPPYLRVTSEEGNKCFLCGDIITAKQIQQRLGDTGWQSLKDNAKKWAMINISYSDRPYCEFTSLEEKIAEMPSVIDCYVHKNCRAKFSTHLDRKQNKYGQKQLDSAAGDCLAEGEMVKSRVTNRQSRRDIVQSKHICFVCNMKMKDDAKPYNEGGLGRCSEEGSATKLLAQKDVYNQPGHKFEDAAKRLQLLICGSSHDIYAVDVYYHKLCYTSFALPRKPNDDEKINEVEEIQKIQERVNRDFFQLFKRKVLKDFEAYLMSELMKDIKEMSEDSGLTQSSIKHSYVLKAKLQDVFGDQISFYKAGRQQIVHPSNLNPCMYAMATLQGAGLRDDDLSKAFGRMIKRKLCDRKIGKWPISPDELLLKLENNGPLTCMYNAIAWSVNSQTQKNKFGYVETSSQSQADKLWAICSDWETLITHERSTKSTALSLTLHRLTGSKESAALLHRCGHGISYSDIRLLNNTWARSVTSQSQNKLPPGFIKGRAIHVAIDNSDGRQQTLTGLHTTHHTNGIVFQTERPSDIATNEEPFHIHSKQNAVLVDEEIPDYGSYKIPKKMSPPPVPDYKDHIHSNLLHWTLKRDIAWVLTSAIGGNLNPDTTQELEPIGSWTAFMKNVTHTETPKSHLEYLEVVPLPPGDNVCKWYMDILIEMADDLELDCIFAHADEAVNCKMVLIKWLHENKYDRIITLIGGFHTLLVKLKIMYKKYGALGFKDWWVDAGVVAEGSVDQASEGRHYYRSIRLHKQSFEALLRYRIVKHCDISLFNEDFKLALELLRCDPTPENLDRLMGLDMFNLLCDEMLTTSGTQSKMIVEYIHDVSALLSLISSVRELSIARHLQAERNFLPQLFAFGHVNYARYLTYQHVCLQDLKSTNPKAWKELSDNGFGGSLSGEPFSTIHGDLIIETTINREVKVKGGPMPGGYSTSKSTTDAFIKTSHIMAKIRAAIKKRLHILASSVHKECTSGAKNNHE